MSLFDFFFPDVAQASHLRRIAEQNSLSNTQRRLQQHRASLDSTHSERKVEAIRKDVDSVCLVIEALLETLDEKGIVTREEIAQKTYEIDGRDGTLDGKITAEEEAPPQRGRFPKKPKFILPD